MNWWRRNWVDALMIALIVGVVGGFAALLLRGSPLNVTNQGPPPASPALENPQPAPASPSTASPATTPAAPEPAPTPPPAPPPEPPPPPPSPTAPPAVTPKPAQGASGTKPSAGTTTQTPGSGGTTKPTSSTKPAPSKPALSKPAQGSGMDANAPSQGGSRQGESRQPVVAAKPIKPPTPTASRPVNPPSPATATANQSTPSRSQFLSSYRVAVGSFSTQSRANAVAARIRAQGLPAAAVPSGKVVVVVVGPYGTESAAQNALRRLAGAYPDAILYRPDGTRSRANTVKPAPSPATPNPSTSSKPSNPTPSNPTASSSNATDDGAYLQVGAFNSTASATPILTQLRRAGYPAQMRSSPDGLTRVLVGPLSADTLRRARTDLRRRGFNPFTVSR